MLKLWGLHWLTPNHHSGFYVAYPLTISTKARPRQWSPDEGEAVFLRPRQVNGIPRQLAWGRGIKIFCIEAALRRGICLEDYITADCRPPVTTICLCMKSKANTACNFNSLFENEGLLKVTASRVHCKRVNIFESVQDSVVVTINHQQKVICNLSNSGNSDDL